MAWIRRRPVEINRTFLIVGAGILFLVHFSNSCSPKFPWETSGSSDICTNNTPHRHGSIGHLPKPVVRPNDFVYENFGGVCPTLEVNVTLVSASVSEWMEEMINQDDVKVDIYYTNRKKTAMSTWIPWCGMMMTIKTSNGHWVTPYTFKGNVSVYTPVKFAYQNCPTSRELTCTVESFYNREGYFYLAINVSDSNGNWQEHCLDKMELSPRAKPSVVENLKLDVINSTAASVSWKSSVMVEMNDPVEYEVVFTPRNFQAKVNKSYPSIAPSGRLYHREVSGLIPHGLYDITLRVRLVTNDAKRMPTGLPSDPAHSSVVMPQDVPARNPDWGPGKFSIKKCGDGCKTSFTVTIYWQDLPEISRNGEIHYEVSVFKMENLFAMKRLLQMNLSANTTSFEVPGIAIGYTYKLQILAATAIGTNSSTEPRVIYVDRKTRELPKPSNVEAVRSKDRSNITVTWKRDDTARSSHYGIVLCRQSTAGKDECQGPLQSAGNETSLVIPVSSKERRLQYRVGVYQLDEDGESTGIVWSPCLFQEGHVPITAPPADIRSQTDELLVKVKQYSCDQSVVPTSRLTYVVDYCSTKDNKTCSGKVSSKSIGPDQINHQFVYPVEPNHFYKVTIHAEAEGRKSPKLVENHFVPMSRLLPAGAIIGIAVIGVLIIGAILVGVLYRRHLKQNPVPIEKIPIYGMEVDESPREEILNIDDEQIKIEKEKLIEERMIGSDNNDDDAWDHGYAKITFIPEGHVVQCHRSIESVKAAQRQTGTDQQDNRGPTLQGINEVSEELIAIDIKPKQCIAVESQKQMNEPNAPASRNSLRQEPCKNLTAPMNLGDKTPLSTIKEEPPPREIITPRDDYARIGLRGFPFPFTHNSLADSGGDYSDAACDTDDELSEDDVGSDKSGIDDYSRVENSTDKDRDDSGLNSDSLNSDFTDATHSCDGLVEEDGNKCETAYSTSKSSVNNIPSMSQVPSLCALEDDLRITPEQVIEHVFKTLDDARGRPTLTPPLESHADEVTGGFILSNRGDNPELHISIADNLPLKLDIGSTSDVDGPSVVLDNSDGTLDQEDSVVICASLANIDSEPSMGKGSSTTTPVEEFPKLQDIFKL